MRLSLPADAYQDRLSTVRNRLEETGSDAAIWFGATSIGYLTGFHHIQTERPVALIVEPSAVGIVVPRLEYERVSDNANIDYVEWYFDYPGGQPIETIAQVCNRQDIQQVHVDADGAPGVMGYDGPALSELLDVKTQSWVDRLRWEKSTPEIELIETSAQWANLGHRYLCAGIEPGAHPATVSQQASLRASRVMLDTLGSRYVPQTRGDGPVHAGFISGPQTRLPHGHTANRRLQRGDVIITGATANIDGYYAELERTMFVEEATDEDRQYFQHMLQAQEIAIETMGPGVEIAAVDQAVMDYFEEQGIDEYAQHHVGHNIGMGAHEPPYIDRGWSDHCQQRESRGVNDQQMQPGQVYTIEPGIYTDDAGYRHSDTVVVTETGTRRLTYFPRDLSANIVDETNRPAPELIEP